MSDAVEATLPVAFPDRAVEELVGVGPSWNGGNETVGVDFADGGRAYLKVAIEGDGSRIARERAVLEHVRASGTVPVPKVLAADSDADPPFLATAPAPGRDLLDVYAAAEDDPERVALLRGVGRTLAALHEGRFGSHGEIVGGRVDAGLELETAGWTDVLLATIERTREIGTTDRLAGHFDAAIDCVEANRSILDEAPAALLHGDVAKPNAFVVDEAAETQVGLIDWELAHVGDPARDLVRARDQLCNDFDSEGPARFGDAVYAGYRERAGGLPEGFETRAPVYRVVRILGRSGFLDQWETYLDTPMPELVERIDAELERRLAAVRAAETADGSHRA
ncbi:aminoglycoside phosphotransferase (APT) family kinase protein [Halorubrum alkaliphilum]|uniref:Aminoglycoside phosphotransferase (APT) family kinase protein n=1 Tax=Halorubrum alkaliphilum TaxID=261290 RepID=A0A8T4G9L2_9EURY|nr:phosphotransferase [Halorubrum alkaliphilum]MBP1921104.1 aminoglycoside phosphotransferase (APT) family kinase protein [Halorubrum alkaliphilum]